MTTMDPSDTVTEHEAEGPGQQESGWLLALVFVGITLRLLVLLLFIDDLNTDPDVYVGIAQTIVDGNGICVPGSDQPTAFRPPLYPLLLAGLNMTGLKLTWAAGLINLLSGAVIIMATWWMAQIAGLERRWTVVAAAAAALDPLLLRYAALPMTESISAALLTVAMLQILKLSTSTAPPRIQTAIVAGCCFGLAGLCRPVGLITCVAVTLALLLAAIKQVRNSASAAYDTHSVPAIRRACVAVLPAAIAGIVLVPWVVRNAIQFGHFIPATTHGGYTLLLGNNPVFYHEVVTAPGQPAWQGESLTHWQQEVKADILADAIEPADDVAVDTWNYNRAVRNIGQQPAAFLQSCLLRWKRFWALRQSVTDPQSSGITATVVAVWYGVLWLGLGRSLFCMDIRGSGHIQLLWLAILSFLLLHTFYWTNARMRAPLTGVIIVLSAVGWQAILHRSPREIKGTVQNAGSN
ncbi:MAG: hypothetical protein P8J37_15265 [Fuerstiella sp.]|nr:hypothetical protein [Fuerstiella sp.]